MNGDITNDTAIFITIINTRIFILDISSDYNSTTWCKPAKKPLIIHYAGTPTKEWNKVSLTTYFKLKTWDEVMDANSRLKG